MYEAERIGRKTKGQNKTKLWQKAKALMKPSLNAFYQTMGWWNRDFFRADRNQCSCSLISIIRATSKSIRDEQKPENFGLTFLKVNTNPSVLFSENVIKWLHRKLLSLFLWSCVYLRPRVGSIYRNSPVPHFELKYSQQEVNQWFVKLSAGITAS